MPRKQPKNFHTLLKEATTFPKVLAVGVKHYSASILIYERLLREARNSAHDHRKSIEESRRALGRLEARRVRYDKYQANRAIPEELRAEIAGLEARLLRKEMMQAPRSETSREREQL